MVDENTDGTAIGSSNVTINTSTGRTRKRKTISDADDTTTTCNNAVSINKQAPPKYCHCNKETNAETMVECTNGAKCVLFELTKGWYHVSCVGLKINTRAIKNENWLCPTCATIAKNQRNKS
jgi:hypothetical protein